MLCMGWQALAFAGSAVILAEEDAQEHALLHWVGESHHHHDDDQDDQDDWDEDDSLASIAHLMGDACIHAPALIPSIALLMPITPPVFSAQEPLALAPLPFLGSLERPPRLKP
jgi:hypothetical protein